MKKPLSCVAALLSVFTLLGCAAQVNHGEGSRSQVYSSLQELVDDSPVIVVVEAKGEREIDARMSRSSTKVAIEEVIRGDVAPDARLIVWQMGTPESPGPSPLLDDRHSYLLFLTPTGLEGASPDEYWVVGGTAGLWSAQGDGYTRLADEGDVLPPRITSEDVTAAMTR